jgi:pantoate--beta-alanine ligase
MEGLHRPGHFQGVAAVLDRFFQMLPMDVAFFGEKDFQQLAVVRKLVELKGHELAVLGCPTIREECGLAMSSRNTWLSPKGRQKACMIHKGLLDIKKQTADVFEGELVLQTIKKWTALGMDVEYLELANSFTFEAAQPGALLSLEDPWRLFAAVHLDGVRLIDNLALKS